MITGQRDTDRPGHGDPIRIRDEDGPVIGRVPIRRARGARNRMVRQAVRHEEDPEGKNRKSHCSLSGQSWCVLDSKIYSEYYVLKPIGNAFRT